jgi:molybdopterin-guanine dinucleotide biosynthesis protein
MRQDHGRGDKVHRQPAPQRSAADDDGEVVFTKIGSSLGLVLLIGLGTGCANKPSEVPAATCSAEQAQQAEAAAATAPSWSQLHDLFARFSACDDGAIAEGFTESVTVLLAEKWDRVQDVISISKGDSAFEDFVIRHIDESAPEARLARIVALATKQCPANAEALCSRIRAAIEGGPETKDR